MRYLRGRKYLDAVCVVLWATTPVLVAALTLGTHALRGQPLEAPTVRGLIKKIFNHQALCLSLYARATNRASRPSVN